MVTYRAKQCEDNLLSKLIPIAGDYSMGVKSMNANFDFATYLLAVTS